MQRFLAEQLCIALIVGNVSVSSGPNSPAQSQSPFGFDLFEQARKILEKAGRRAIVTWIHDISLEKLRDSLILGGRH
jgi:hypothetical protein